MSILVIAEHDNKHLKPDTAKVLSAARAMGDDIHLLVAGHQCQEVIRAATELDGVAKVLVLDEARFAHALPEALSQAIVALAADYSHLVAASSTTGKNLMPRVAAKLDVAQISDIIAVDSADTFKRPIYAGNAIATVQALDATKVVTVRPAAFDASGAGNNAPVVTLQSDASFGASRFIGAELTESERPELSSARVVISGGRGLQSGDNFKMLEALADKLGAAIGASRAAVDAGFVPNDWQVGQTGKIVAPDLYIAVGISGAIQHLAGMKDSKVIVAINKDPEAPIFQVADYGLVGDLFEIVPELTEKL
ncbi:electron transfer flavoprotein subunit alpha/FixB family protein [Gallaecimonas xiamenensis]|uniref:Electron transfer flavoprotein subunit alpha n=1 Tax=Gallaecimonas xiamenensis 3-C-1 TaxID=745411 RepID=K2JTA3_9GAMM|nr:FAD-binding protein [Gallaecimonas xiamenensis]EKE68405.1 electron transfer flavoprotein subunit alpha [Gallaecimonas xiamenensis 3-C-1]